MDEDFELQAALSSELKAMMAEDRAFLLNMTEQPEDTNDVANGEIDF